MSAMQNIGRSEVEAQVKTHLSLFHMPAYDIWISGCVEHFIDEGFNLKEIKDNAYQQWLLNDLRYISSGSLPRNLPELDKTVLNGQFVLQINSVLDISVPAYQQYLKIKKTDTENIKATMNPEEKISSKRMLKFELTDGVQTIAGIEYETLSKVKTENIIPGCKMKITGPVWCRKGMLLLTDAAIELLGGEVQSLLETHSLAAQLACKLNLPLIENDPSEVAQITYSTNGDVTQEASTVAHNRSVQNNVRPAPAVQNNSVQNNVRTTAAVQHNSLHNNVHTAAVAQNRGVQNDVRTSAVPQDRGLQNDDRSSVVPQNRSGRNNIETSTAAQHRNNVTNRQIPVCNQPVIHSSPGTSGLVQMSRSNSYALGKRQIEADDQPEKKMKFDDDDDDDDLLLEEHLREIEKYERLHNSAPSPPVILPAEPFVYIKQINGLSESNKNGKVFRVKAQVQNVLTKLTMTAHREWNLKCTITDGTGCMDVEFASEILSKFLGYTPEDISELKKQVAINPRIKNDMKLAYAKTAETLRTLYCIMELTMYTLPKITRLIDFGESHVDLLRGRLNNEDVALKLSLR